MATNQTDDITILACSSCGARFKIRNPQPGAEFACNRCQEKVVVPGENPAVSSDQQPAKPRPEILKIELHKSSYQKGQQDRLPVFPVSAKLKFTPSSTAKDAIREDALEIKDRQSGRFTKKIFASDVQNRQRLLYLISLYSEPARPEEKGLWIRKLPLQVFMFEGVIREIFDWDYAPASVFTSEGRTFINISQEGEEDLYALLGDDYVHNLKLTTSEHRNITAYQITQRGLAFLDKIPAEDKNIVDTLVQCPQCKGQTLVQKQHEHFDLVCERNECDYCYRSSITEAEDVSYFCIPYFLPTLSKFQYLPPSYIKKRLEHYFKSNPQDNIKDTLEELIYLSNVKVLISEWLPFGSNHMAALNYKLGSNDRVQSAKFTQELDTAPDGTTIRIPESLTLVKVRDYSLASYVDFEAFIYLPEDPDIIQVEEFAVHITSTGYVRYGLEILAINNRDHDKISLDHLPRVLVDVLQDSTSIMETLLTSYQKNLLELIFQGKARYRDKYFFVIASDIRCFEHKEGEATAVELMRILSQPNYQDELNQVTEEVKETALFPDGTVLIVGSHGSILVTRTPEHYERLVSDFLFAMDLEIFLNNFFVRLFMMNDELKDIQNLIKNCETDPNAIAVVQQMLSRISSDTILMAEVRSYLEDAVTSFGQRLQQQYQSYGDHMQEAIQTFHIPEMVNDLDVRIRDIKKVINGTQECLQGLTRVTEVISERQMRRIQEALSQNTRSLEDITKTNERSGMSLRILEIILAGSLAFSIMDQFTGEWSPSQNSLFRPYLQKIFDVPGAWLMCSLLLWSGFAVGLFMLMRWLENFHSKAIATRIKLDMPCDVKALMRYLADKEIVTRDADIFNIGNFIKVCWEEKRQDKWMGNRPKMELVYDEKNSFVLSAQIEVNRPTRDTTADRLRQALLQELNQAGVFHLS